jgi:hypothetical protein
MSPFLKSSSLKYTVFPCGTETCSQQRKGLLFTSHITLTPIYILFQAFMVYVVQTSLLGHYTMYHNEVY